MRRPVKNWMFSRPSADSNLLKMEVWPKQKQDLDWKHIDLTWLDLENWSRDGGKIEPRNVKRWSIWSIWGEPTLDRRWLDTSDAFNHQTLGSRLVVEGHGACSFQWFEHNESGEIEIRITSKISTIYLPHQISTTISQFTKSMLCGYLPPGLQRIQDQGTRTHESGTQNANFLQRHGLLINAWHLRSLGWVAGLLGWGCLFKGEVPF